jgi:phosphate transport system permease protein
MSHDSIQGKAKPVGEKWVWLSSMGLAIGILMVAGLLGLILRNGLAVFWPKPLVRIELAEGSRFAMRGSLVLGGGLYGSRTKVVQRGADDGGTGGGADREWHLLIGNKDVYGASFRYVDVDAAVSIERPGRAIWIERTEYGPALGMPAALRDADGTEWAADHAEFDAKLRAAVEEAADLREELQKIERGQIGRISHEMNQLRTAGKKMEPEALAKRRLALHAEYEALAAHALDLRAKLISREFVYRLFTGETSSFPVGQIVDFHYPNAMGLGEKAKHFAVGMWRFVSEEPREANMEGGIFPAIFGTFAMTLLMCAAVMPFGVLAAIYLREYAKQGLFVRMVRISVNNLAGVPSIVFGVFGLGFFVYFVGGSLDKLFYADALPTPTFGTGGILWAALTLALMTVPVVIVATEEALAAVPRGVREGSLALGASKWQTIYRVVLPASAPGILTGLVLAIARGAGEVAPLMLVGVVKLAPSLPFDSIAPFVHLDRKFMHLGFHIYDLGFQSPDSEASQPMVFATTLFLILLVVLLNFGAIVVRERLRRRYAAGAF